MLPRSRNAIPDEYDLLSINRKAGCVNSLFRNLDNIHICYVGKPWSNPQPIPQQIQPSGWTRGNHLDRAVRAVGDRAPEPQGSRRADYEPAVPHPLDPAEDPEAACRHQSPVPARAWRRCRSHSIPIGRTEMTMMAMITAVKFCLTTGMFPNR